jgi:tetratricopeptide (TPR) repeat protein
MKKLIFTILLGLVSFSSCKEYLEEKPDKSLAIPSDKLQYLRLLLDNNGVMNQYNPATADIASDDSYIPESLWPKLLQAQRTSANAYIWAGDMFNETERSDWATPYQMVFYSNLVLEGLTDLDGQQDVNEWKDLKGSALFYRSYAFFNLLQTFAKAYSKESAATNPGIVIKLTSDINEKLPRASVQQSYEQVLKDLAEAIPLLSGEPEFDTRPGKTAAFALLARVYLVMQNFEKALQYSEQALAIKSTLLDLNKVNATASFPISRVNPEMIFYTTLTGMSGMSATYGRVNGELYKLFSDGDLRKQVFFRITNGEVFYKGMYTGTSVRFNGLATDELYLISAECYGRLGQLSPALSRLNQLLEKRWKPGSFVPVTVNSNPDVVKIILNERRKELCYRNRRWSDLKRLNLDKEHQKTLTRIVNGKTYTLLPGDSRYAMPIPLKVIQASGIVQN